MHPVGVPVGPTRLIGRGPELGDVAHLLERADIRLVTLVGPGGVGKTRLAAEIAAARAAATSRVVFVGLADVAPGGFAAALLARLGGAAIGTRTPLELAIDLLDDDPVLLVLDNLEHLADAPSDVAQLIDAVPGLKVVATSRRPLGLRAERCVHLGPLAVPDHERLGVAQSLAYDGVALFVARLEAADSRYRPDDDDMAAIVRICRRLDGLPLALELAAARARSLPLGAIADALDARIDVLGPASPDLPARHQSLAAAMAWSVDLLGTDATALFRRLAVYAGATVDAVADIGPDLGLDRPGVLDALDELVAHSLVIKDPSGRFRMLHVVRDVALDQLAQAGETGAARDRHARWFLAVAQGVAADLNGAKQRAALDRLSVEAPNLHAAVRHALDAGDTEVALRLCLALRMLWYVRGPLAEGRALFDAALALPGAPDPLRAAAMIEASALARHHGALDRADALTDGALAYARVSPDDRLLAAALLQRGFVLHLVGRYGEARPVLEESLALSQRLDDGLAVARAWHHLGIVAYYGDGEVALAWELQCRCLALFRDLGNERHILTSLIVMTALARARGDLDAARRLTAEAAGHLRRLGDEPLLIFALHTVAGVRYDEASPTRALRLLGAAEGREAATGAAAWPVVTSGAQRWLSRAQRSVGQLRADELRFQARRLSADQALALLDEPASAQDPTALSRREEEIAALVAQGLTNRAIAERLFLSPRTVDGHVARALTKLGLHNRAELAAHVAGRTV